MKSGVESPISIAVLAAVLAVYAASEAGAGARAEANASGDDSDDESDSAPFTVVVEHADGWRCSAALVSLRTALTSARCALGRGAEGARELWARAPRPGGASPAASRVLRVAYAAGADLDAVRVDASVPGTSHGAATAARDVALLELASALDGARAILLATSRADCEPPPGADAARACYLVRALGSGAGTRLRIVELSLRSARFCWAPPAPLPAAAHRALCLAGPELCQSELGAGVVCGGKLCGVLSASRGAEVGADCGAPHVAASVPRWRLFLHCALARGACGRDGKCARLCTERWLVEEEPPGPPPAAPPDSLHASSVAAPALDGEEELPTRTTLADVTEGVSVSPRTLQMPAAPAPTRSPAAPPAPPAPPEGVSTAAAAAARHALEFEPNRADFTAGEYGDNAAEYAAPVDEPAPAPPTEPLAAPPAEPLAAPPAEPLAAPPEPAPEVPAPVPARRSRAPRSAALPPHLLPALLCVCCTVYGF